MLCGSPQSIRDTALNVFSAPAVATVTACLVGRVPTPVTFGTLNDAPSVGKLPVDFILFTDIAVPSVGAEPAVNVSVSPLTEAANIFPTEVTLGIDLASLVGRLPTPVTFGMVNFVPRVGSVPTPVML